MFSSWTRDKERLLNYLRFGGAFDERPEARNGEDEEAEGGIIASLRVSSIFSDGREDEGDGRKEGRRGREVVILGSSSRGNGGWRGR